MDTFERPSTWALALAAGALVAGVGALADLGHVAHPLVYYALLAVVSFGAVLGFVHGVPTLLWLLTLALGVARDWRTTFGKPSPPAAAEAPSADDLDAGALARSADAPPERGGADALLRAQTQLRAHWDTYWQWLMQAGDAYGFTQAALTTEGTPTKIMSEDAWNKTIPHVVYAGVLMGGKVGKPTKWAPDWSLEQFEREETWRQLPHPKYEPPEIAPPPYSATPQHHTTARATPAKGVPRVVEGVGTPVEG